MRFNKAMWYTLYFKFKSVLQYSSERQEWKKSNPAPGGHINMAKTSKGDASELKTQSDPIKSAKINSVFERKPQPMAAILLEPIVSFLKGSLQKNGSISHSLVRCCCLLEGLFSENTFICLISLTIHAFPNSRGLEYERKQGYGDSSVYVGGFNTG